MPSCSPACAASAKPPRRAFWPRALNCTGPDGTGGPTPDPCGVCENCVAILADRHPDVVEMDAASNTGVDDVREIIEATRFRPLSARIKVFIIDEVHMLSKAAFNALLKTLEEPPPHIKFVLATTEIRKVPITVLSRCQRFDLRRVAVDVLAAHFTRIAAVEHVAIAPGAIEHIARAADGSVRDGLSLLDQAIARGAEDGAEISAPMVADMLGLADRGFVFDLMDAVVAGDTPRALKLADDSYERGGDPGVLLADLLDLAHLLTRMKSVPGLAEQRRPARGRAHPRRRAGADALHPLPRPAVADAAEGSAGGRDLPGPARRRGDDPHPPVPCRGHAAPGRADQETHRIPGGALGGGGVPGPHGGGARAVANGGIMLQEAPRALTFNDVVALAAAKRDVMLYAHLRQSVHVVRFAPPVIELRLSPDAPRDIVQKLARRCWRPRPGGAGLRALKPARRAHHFEKPRARPPPKPVTTR